ncbi:MAG: hypothetical protein ACOX6C_02090 [Patescibacteria group bacterium]
MNFEQKFANFKVKGEENKSKEVESKKDYPDLPTREEIDAAPFFSSREAFDRWVQKKKNTRGGAEELDNFSRLVERTAGGPSADIFKSLMENEEKNKNLPEEEREEFRLDPLKRINEMQATKLYDEDMVLGKIDVEDLGDILKNLDKDTREFVFARRNNLTLKEAKEILVRRLNDSVIVYHTSPTDIDFKKGLKGEVYFSTDIKRLFKAPGARYLYAFRLPADQVANSKYGALDCFGRLRASGVSQPISDKISIYDFDQPGGNQKEILDALGAGFSDYVPATGHAENFMNNHEPSVDLNL